MEPGPGNDDGLEVDRLGRADLRFAARLHERSLRAGLFPLLGVRFLRAYYATFVDSPYGVALVARRGGAPIGVLAGTSDDRRHYQWVLRRRWMRLAPLALLGLVRRPPLLVRFVRHRAGRYVRGAARLARTPSAPAGGAAPPPAPSASLTHLAVAEESRGGGVGAALASAYADRAFAAGATRLTVATAGEDGAGAFYRRCGWQVVSQRTDLDGHTYDVLERRADEQPGIARTAPGHAEPSR